MGDLRASSLSQTGSRKNFLPYNPNRDDCNAPVGYSQTYAPVYNTEGMPMDPLSKF